MKDFERIKADRRFQLYGRADDGGNGWVTISGKMLFVVFSFGGGWDHVSVSLKNRCPTWDEMCVVKDVFFDKEECCIEYHPAEKDYVNFHPYCLHIWKPQNETIPTPPKIFV